MKATRRLFVVVAVLCRLAEDEQQVGEQGLWNLQLFQVFLRLDQEGDAPEAEIAE